MFANKNNDIVDRLYEAIKNRDLEETRAVILEADSQHLSLNATHPRHQVSPLHWAILKCNSESQQHMIDIMNLLYEANIDVNLAANAKLRFTPLHSAARRSLPDVVEWMMHHGADPHAKDGTGQTPLDYVNKSLAHQSENNNDTYNRLVKVKNHLSGPPAGSASNTPCTIL